MRTPLRSLAPGRRRSRAMLLSMLAGSLLLWVALTAASGVAGPQPPFKRVDTLGVGSGLSYAMVRTPNGVLQDLRTYWTAGKAHYDPADIHVPTLIIHAEWDADLPSDQAQAYFAKLTNAPYKRFVELGEGTHSIIMEKNRLDLFRAVQAFLDEGGGS